MLGSILIGLDGSPYSETALRLGVRWAKEYYALLIGLGIVDEPDIRAPAPTPLGGDSFKAGRDERLVADARQQVGRFLEHFARCCVEHNVDHQILEVDGDPYEQLALQAQRYDLIMLGRETHFHFETQEGPDDRLLRDLVRGAPRPVVIVPESLGDGRAAVVAYDGSVQASRTLAAFEATGLAAREHVYVVSVGADPGEASRHADLAAEFLGLHGVKATAIPVGTPRDPGRVLLEHARDLEAQLLVMGAYGKSALREFFLGSVTKTVLREAAVPVFLYH